MLTGDLKNMYQVMMKSVDFVISIIIIKLALMKK